MRRASLCRDSTISGDICRGLSQTNPGMAGGDSNEGTYKTTGGTGKYKGASGSGTYTLDPKGLAEPLSGGTYNYNGKLELP